MWCARTLTIIGMCLLITFFSLLPLMWGLRSSPVSCFALRFIRSPCCQVWFLFLRSSCFCIYTVFSIHSLRFYSYVLNLVLQAHRAHKQTKKPISVSNLSLLFQRFSFHLWWKWWNCFERNEWMYASVNKSNGHRLRWKKTERLEGTENTLAPTQVSIQSALFQSKHLFVRAAFFVDLFRPSKINSIYWRWDNHWRRVQLFYRTHFRWSYN